MKSLKLHLSQINTTVGDLDGNCQKILAEFKKAESLDCDLVIFPEMTISGYPCMDLWQKKYFIAEINQKISEICEATNNSKCAILLGSPHYTQARGKDVIYNSAFLIEDGEVKKIIHKKSLPNYSVFDEERYFTADNFISLLEFREFTIAVLICEDLWELKNLLLLKEQIFDGVIVINSSPYEVNKHQVRIDVAKKFTNTLNKPLIYVNQVGGQDSLVFDGTSFALDNKGEIALLMESFAEDSAEIKITKDGEISGMNLWTGLQTPSSINTESNISTEPTTNRWAEFATVATRSCQTNPTENNYNACVLGLRDYIHKNNFKKVLLGMSGGIDSALVATMAVDALNSENVSLYALPSRFNSEESMKDAVACAKNLNVKLEVISIEESFKAMLTTLGEVSNLTKENLQSRIRGNILMALSNNSGALLLTTGNKSELAMGYATLYGDMCGAFNPIKDLYKTEIYQLTNYRNCTIPKISLHQKTNVIPQNIIIKEPTAELRENQKDSDSLPEYEILDKILYQIIEEERSTVEIVKSGFSEELVNKIAKTFFASEYKRKQSTLGPKVSKMSFDNERRYPITNKFIS